MNSQPTRVESGNWFVVDLDRLCSFQQQTGQVRLVDGRGRIREKCLWDPRTSSGTAFTSR